MMGSGCGTRIEGAWPQVRRSEDHPAGVLNQLSGDLLLTGRLGTQLIPDLQQSKGQ